MNVFKKLALALTVLVALVVATLVIIPLVINIDQYRPEIIKLANDHLNGTVNIDKLALSLWGRVEITVEGAKLSDPDGVTVLDVKRTHVLMPFSSLLAGTPHMTMRLDQPQIHVTKNKRGVLNITKIMKPTPQTAPKPAEPKPEPQANGPVSAKVVSLVRQSSVDIDLVKAQLSFVDDSTGFSQGVTDLDVSLHDVSMTKAMKLAISADLLTKLPSGLNVQGPLAATGVVIPRFEGLVFDGIGLDLEVNADALTLSVPGVFAKPAGAMSRVLVKCEANAKSIDLQAMTIRFVNAELSARGRLDDIDAVPPLSPRIEAILTSNAINLAPWAALIPALKDLDPQGTLTLAAGAKGPLATMDYHADVSVEDFSAALPGLVERPVFQLDAAVVPNELKALKLSMQAPENSLTVTMSLKNFAAPLVKVDISSPGLNLDKLLPPAPPAPPSTEAPAPGATAPVATADKKPGPNVDAMLTPVRNSAFLKALKAQIELSIARVEARGMVVTNIDGTFVLKDLLATIENLDLEIWKGKVALDAALDLNPEIPTYHLKLGVDGLDMQSAVASHLQAFANTVLGSFNLMAEGSGASLNPDLILKNLDIAGRVAIADAKFQTIDIAKMTVDGLNAAIDKVKAKIPELGDKTLKFEGTASRYRLISGTFSLKDGRFKAPDFSAESYPKQGIDFKGSTEIGLLDDTIKARWVVVDTYDQTGALKVGIAMKGVNIDGVLAEAQKPVSFPVNVDCKLSAPCFDYGALPEHFVVIVLNNLKGKLQSAAETELKAKAQAALDKEKAEFDAKKQQLEAEVQAKLDAEKAKAAKSIEGKSSKAFEALKGQKIKKLPF